jgi:hypothetical protein
MVKKSDEHVLSADLKNTLGKVAAPRATKVASTQGQPERDKVAATFYIPRPTHRRLKEMALARSTSLQQLLEEAVDEWLGRSGEPPFHPEQGQ